VPVWKKTSNTKLTVVLIMKTRCLWLLKMLLMADDNDGDVDVMNGISRHDCLVPILVVEEPQTRRTTARRRE